MVMIFAAFIWGFSEATFFFIIPDVLLSYYAVRVKKFKKIFIVNLVCLAGAAAGGTVIFMMSTFNHSDVIDFMLTVPAVHPYMLGHVDDQMSTNPFIALITGPLFGVPYKLFASFAPQYTTIFIFVLFSIPARFTRFIIVSLLAFIISHKVFPGLAMKVKTAIWMLVWIIVYAVYFSIHPF